MNPSGNYSWSNTAQWSQVPTNNNPAPQNTSTQGYNDDSNQQNNYMPAQPMNTENRKDMIDRLYHSILGRDADTAGLNYYLYNTHITEYQIAKDMFESTEHNEILQKAKDIRDMIHKTEEATKKMNDMEFTLQSLQTLNESYKNLIDQKTQTINELRNRFNLGGEYTSNYDSITSNQVHQEHPQYSQQNQISQSQNQSASLPEDFFLDDPFENEYSNRQGCLGWLQSWFKFR